MNEALWLLGRGTGVATLVLLTASVVLGLLTAGGLVSRELPRFALPEIHRRASLGATVLLVLHLGSLWLDPVAQLRAVALVVPFLGARNPVWWGLGTLAADLVVVLVVTSLLRRRMPHVVWRRLHWLSYGAWPLAFLHGLGSGTDAGTWWVRGMAAGCFVAVVSAAGYRLAAPDDVAARRTVGGPAGRGSVLARRLVLLARLRRRATRLWCPARLRGRAGLGLRALLGCGGGPAGEGRHGLGGRRGRVRVGLLQLAVDLFAVDVHVARSGDAEPHGVAVDLEHRDDDVVTDDEALLGTSAEHQHGRVLSPAARTTHPKRRRGASAPEGGRRAVRARTEVPGWRAAPRRVGGARGGPATQEASSGWRSEKG